SFCGFRFCAGLASRRAFDPRLGQHVRGREDVGFETTFANTLVRRSSRSDRTRCAQRFEPNLCNEKTEADQRRAERPKVFMAARPHDPTAAAHLRAGNRYFLPAPTAVVRGSTPQTGSVGKQAALRFFNCGVAARYSAERGVELPAHRHRRLRSGSVQTMAVR